MGKGQVRCGGKRWKFLWSEGHGNGIYTTVVPEAQRSLSLYLFIYLFFGATCFNALLSCSVCAVE